ncbi:hypothetical protein ACFWPX_30190 [Nocardia sp. NPDC058518]|uniref:hypothetical protein n=1 Tax=Nocardia sp. NPDC058518 TaxID=3346534 RepID=UPI00366232D7
MTNTNAPMTEPTQRTGDRRDRYLTASWPVGEPDAKGWQARTDLNVSYYKGIGYRAVVNTLHERQEGTCRTQRVNLGMGKTATEIHTQPATRYNAKTLTQVYDTAVSELRRRYEADDDTVTPYFNADSPAFIYFGAPSTD